METSQWKIVILSLALFASASFAGEGVLVSYIPKGATKQHVIAIIQQAFVNRQWRVVKTDESSVTAKLDHRSYDAEMTISLSGNALLYTAGSTFTEKSHMQAGMISFDRKVSKDIPTAWIANLRADISRTMSAIPNTTTATPNQEHSSGTSTTQSNAAERLKALENLHSSGLITEQEYTQKRQAIIDSL